MCSMIHFSGDRTGTENVLYTIFKTDLYGENMWGVDNMHYESS